jgi:hypothetical protein
VTQIPYVLVALITVSVKSFGICHAVFPVLFRKSCMPASSGVRKRPFALPPTESRQSGVLVNNSEVTRTSHDRDPELCVLSEERNPVRNKL